MIPTFSEKQERQGLVGLGVATLAAVFQTVPYAGSHLGFASLMFAVVGLPLQMVLAYAVLRLQVVNPFCPRVLLRLFCAFFFYAGALSVVAGFAISVFWHIPELPGNTSTSAGAGAAIGAYIVNKRFGLTPHWLWG